MKQRPLITIFLALIPMAILLAGCGTQTGTATPAPAPTVEGNATVSSYPKTGHAPDYAWIAGRVTFTKIQGGCVYIYTDPADIQEAQAVLTPAPDNGISGPTVGTSVHNDTSPPLRDITPQTEPQATQAIGTKFVPDGSGWDESKVKDGDYVVLVGRPAAAGEPSQMCPGGTAYMADSLLMNP